MRSVHIKIVFFCLLLSALIMSGTAQERPRLPFNGMIISWQANSEHALLHVRTRENKGWSEWEEVRPDEDHDEREAAENNTAGEWGSYETLFNVNQSTDFEFRSSEGIRAVKIEPIFSEYPTSQRKLVSHRGITGIPIITRAEWGANEEFTYRSTPQEFEIEESPINDETLERSEIIKDDPEIKKIVTQDDAGREYLWPLQYAKKIRFIVVHHTAGTKTLDNPKQAVQNIFYYHAVKRGWGDIGYNFVIDHQGNIYEGRKGGTGVVGGHALPLNKTSVGIAILGNFENGEIPARALESLLILSEKLSKLHSIELTSEREYRGKRYRGLHGHGDNSATLCPGLFIRRQLDSIRNTVAYRRSPDNPLASPHDFRDLKRNRLIVVPADQPKRFSLKLKNTGETEWGAETSMVELGSDPPKKIAALAEKKVRPGEIGIFTGTIPRTLASGLRVTQARVALNNETLIAKEFSLPIFIEGYSATYEVVSRKDPPEIMQPGEKATAWIQLKNTGTVTWRRRGEHAIKIATIKDAKSQLFGGKSRIGRLLEKEVRPGEIGKFVFSITAPTIGGAYTEYFQPVIENGMRLKNSGLNFTVKVDVHEEPIRILLRSFQESKAVFKSDNRISVFEGAQRRFFIEPKTQFSVKFDGATSAYIVKVRADEHRFTDVPRIRAIQNGTIKIVNFDNRPEWNQNLNDNIYQGVLEVRLKDRTLQLINELSIEDYLKGVAEISNTDHPEKIKTIIILARSYARYHRDHDEKFPNDPYHINDDPNSSQKYVGYGLAKRSPNIVKSVEETKGLIVTYKGTPVITPYFSQSDGRTRSAEEVWKWKHTPYLQSVDDSHCGKNKLLGHGVGLSGCGASELAKQGKSAEEIIKYYYQGVEVERR